METKDEKEKRIIAKVKSEHKGRTSFSNSKGDKVYTRLKINSKPEMVQDEQDFTDQDNTLFIARSLIDQITNEDIKLEEIPEELKNHILWFLYTFVSYLEDAVDLKTRLMCTTMNIDLPDNLRLDDFQRDTILDFYQGIMDSLDRSVYTLFMYHNLYGLSYLRSSDNWERVLLSRLSREGVQGSLKSIKDKLTSNPGLTLADLFRYLEKNPIKAAGYFKDSISVSTNKDYQKLSEIYDIDPDSLTLDQLQEMSKLAFPLMEGLDLMTSTKVLNPSDIGGTISKSEDTGRFTVDLEESELLKIELEFTEALNRLEEFNAKYPERGEESAIVEEGYLKDLAQVDADISNLIKRLVYKGYDYSWVEHNIYYNHSGVVQVSNDPYTPLHVFKIEGNEDLENSKVNKLIMSAIDLFNVELRQRSHINDTREKLVTLNISDEARVSIDAGVLDDIVEDIATAVMSGESQILSLPAGVEMVDNTELIRASADTGTLEDQSKSNLARAFSMSKSMLDDSETQFSNMYLKIDTAQNSFAKERSEISKTIEDKILKPAAAKAGLFVKNKQGKVVLAYPRISFTKINIGRQTEDYQDITRLVEQGDLPKSHLYEYHNLSKSKVEAELVKESLSLTNPIIMSAMVNKLTEAIAAGDVELIGKVLKGDTLGVLGDLSADKTKPIEPEPITKPYQG